MACGVCLRSNKHDTTVRCASGHVVEQRKPDQLADDVGRDGPTCWRRRVQECWTWTDHGQIMADHWTLVLSTSAWLTCCDASERLIVSMTCLIDD